MPITESKLKDGSLILGGPAGFAKFATQATNIQIEPKSKDEGDPVETQDGSTLAADKVTEWTLKAKAIQDFTDPAGLIAYSWENDGDQVSYEWKPRGASGPTYSGTVRIAPLATGGDVNKRLSTDVEWALSGKPVVTYPAG